MVGPEKLKYVLFNRRLKHQELQVIKQSDWK
jgi:hypothetical protein